MEQKENHNQPSGKQFASLCRLRAQGTRLSVPETPNNKGSVWNEATSNNIPKMNEYGALREESSSVFEKNLFTCKRFPHTNGRQQKYPSITMWDSCCPANSVS